MEELDYEDVLLIHPDEDLKKMESIETYANSPLGEVIEADADSNLEQTIEIDANSPLEGAIESDEDSNLEQTNESDANSPFEGAIESDEDSNLEQTIESDANSPAIETDADSNSEQTIATDTNLHLGQAMEADANSNLEGANETDGNSNLKLAIEPNVNLNLELAAETGANSNLEQTMETDDNTNLEQAVQTGPNSNFEQASDSDSGEIDDDEEANDLEEGEIKDSSTVLKKKSDIACRFFKRGSCAFGSQCQYLHVSDTVYKMFETNPQNRKDLQPVEHQHFVKPIIFSSNVLPPRPFIEPPIPVAPKADFHRQYDALEDNWEKGLEQARILIRKANWKRKNVETEPKKFNSKNNDDEKVKGQYFTKTNLGNEIPLANSKKYCEKTFTNNSLRRVDASDENKLTNRYQPRPSDKWVDPWRRSKSRQRSRSVSPPSRTRKRSYSSSTSSTSSSSEFDGNYRRSHKKKSPMGRRVSKSRSISQPRQSKKRKVSPKHSFNGRRNFRSSSRSVSRSPSRKRNSLSRSMSSSSSSSSDFDVSPTPEDKEMKRISAKLSEQFHPKAPNRASSLLRSDCETSELTVSSASCTSLSSDSETESPHHSPSLKRKQSPIRINTSSYSNKTTTLANSKVFNRSESNVSKSRDVMQRKNDVVPSFHKKMQHFNSGKNQNNRDSKTDSTDCRPKNTALNFNSGKKPASEFPKPKRSDDMNLLFMYQDLRSSNINDSNLQNPTKVQPDNPALKLNKTDNTMKVANKANSNSETAKKISKVRNVSNHDMDMLFVYQGLGSAIKNSNNIQSVKPNNPTLKPNKTDAAVKVANKANSCSESRNKLSNVMKHNIVLNLQPKSKDYSKPEIHNKTRDLDETETAKKKAAISKREKLLNKLKLIDDAIARKKYK